MHICSGYDYVELKRTKDRACGEPPRFTIGVEPPSFAQDLSDASLQSTNELDAVTPVGIGGVTEQQIPVAAHHLGGVVARA
ncbi:MAG: hypothetical protein CSA58_08115 [Micrococcales bacterium]|nr:MAG: hypothetical protein CSB46_01980 [Micrococcales bacterium]PIE26714.1 MAG: hypothetical protein CSA58_08115 [Micrococcales bacterium]